MRAINSSKTTMRVNSAGKGVRQTQAKPPAPHGKYMGLRSAEESYKNVESGFACHPALDQGHCCAERTNPADTGFRSIYAAVRSEPRR